MLKREDARTGDDGPRVTVTVEEVRYPSQLEELDGLIIPGGESTTLSVFLRQNDFEEKLKSFVRDKKRPVWGTCAGLILLSNQLDSQKKGGQVTVSQTQFSLIIYLSLSLPSPPLPSSLSPLFR